MTEPGRPRRRTMDCTACRSRPVARLQRPSGDDLLQRAAQNAQVLLGVAVFGAAGVFRGEQPVAAEQNLALRQPVGVRDMCEHLPVPRRPQPVDEQLVAERLPHGERLALGLDGRVGTPPYQGVDGLGDSVPMDSRGGVRRGPVRRARQEPQPVGERLQFRHEVERRAGLTMAHQPGHGEQRGLLGHTDLVAAAVQPVPQPGESRLGEAVGEERAPLSGHPETPRGLGLVRLERAARACGPCGEAAPHHLRSYPGREPDHGRTRTDRQPA